MSNSRQPLVNPSQGYIHSYERMPQVPMQYVTRNGPHYRAGEAVLSGPHREISQLTSASRLASSPCPTQPQMYPPMPIAWSGQTVPTAAFAKANPVRLILFPHPLGQTSSPFIFDFVSS